MLIKYYLIKHLILQKIQNMTNAKVDLLQWFIYVLIKKLLVMVLTLFRMGFFGAAHRWGLAKKATIHKICHTYPTMMKLSTVIAYLKKFQKTYESRDTPLEFCWNQHFLLEISKLCYIKKYRYSLQFDTQFLILLTFLEFLKVVLINMVTIFMMSGKMATPCLLKIKAFWNREVIITSIL